MAYDAVENAEAVDELVMTEGEQPAAIAEAETEEVGDLELTESEQPATVAEAEEADDLEMSEGEQHAATVEAEAQESAATQSATDTSEDGGEAAEIDSSAGESSLE